MKDLTTRLKSFEIRVRLVRSWRGLAMGACLGAGISSVWAFLDWRGVFYTEWLWMGTVVGGLALLGALIGLAMRVKVEALVASIDRRAGLEDRLATARERRDVDESFDLALRSDAEDKLASIQPKRVFPIRLGRWQGGAAILSALAASIFLLGNTPIALSEEGKHTREDLKKQGQAVERVRKQNFETPDAKREMSEEEKRLADEMRKYQRDLEKAHVSKEEALQKADELAKKADNLMNEAAKSTEQSLAEAQTARESMEKAELQKAGLGAITPQMASMPPGERQQKQDQAKKEESQLRKDLAELKRQLDELNKKLSNPNLSQQERKSLEERKKSLEEKISKTEKDMKANQELQKALELSKEAQEVFKKMMDDPLYKQLMEIEKKLAQDSQSQSQSGKPQMSDEERKQLQQKLEELAKKLKDSKAMKEYLEALIKAMKEAKEMGRCNGASIGLNGMPLNLQNPTLAQQPPPGPGDTSPGVWQGNIGQVYKLDKPTASKGKTTTSVISGSQRDGVGPQEYVEIKAPSLVGNRTSVPYQNVLPSYKKKAESALNRQEIPKEHQKRVKEYFESLTGPKKS